MISITLNTTILCMFSVSQPDIPPECDCWEASPACCGILPAGPVAGGCWNGCWNGCQKGNGPGNTPAAPSSGWKGLTTAVNQIVINTSKSCSKYPSCSSLPEELNINLKSISNDHKKRNIALKDKLCCSEANNVLTENIINLIFAYGTEWCICSQKLRIGT